MIVFFVEKKRFANILMFKFVKFVLTKKIVMQESEKKHNDTILAYRRLLLNAAKVWS